MKEALSLYFTEIKDDFKVIKDAYQYKLNQSSLVNSSSSALPENLKQKVSNLSLLDFLPYQTFDSKNSLFENEKTIGFILRVGHFSGINEAAKQAFKSLIAGDLPKNTTLQIINLASTKIDYLIDDWAKQNKDCRNYQIYSQINLKKSTSKARKTNNIFDKIVQKRKEFFLKASKQNIIKNKGDLVLRDYELYFCFSCSKPTSNSSKLAVEFQLKALQEKFINGLKAINSSAYLLNDRDFISLLQEILYPSNIATMVADDTVDQYKDLYKKPKNSPHLLMNLENDYQVLLKKDKAIVTADGVTSIIPKVQSKYIIFEVTNLPEVWDLSSSIDYIGNFEHGMSLPCPFYITQGFTLADREESQRIADKHRMIKTQATDSKLPMFFPKMIEERNDWFYVSELLSQGERMGKLVIYIVLMLNNGIKEETAMQMVHDHFARIGFSLARVYYDCLNAFIQTLPFGMSENWPIIDQLKISHKALSGACINLMPVFADSQNYFNPLMLLVGRRGQVFFFDNFKTADNLNGNFNMVVVGASGRGKSVWLQEYSVSLLRSGGNVVIIDDGRSFKNTCELLDGDFVDFGGGEFCLNPFSLYQPPKSTEDSQEYKENFEEPFIDLVVSILCIIANIDKNNNLDPDIGLYRSIFTNAVIAVMEKKGNQAGFSDIRKELLTNKEIRSQATTSLINKIEYLLRQYSNKGRYAKYFNGRATLQLNHPFTVFELSDLEHNEILQSTALLTVTFLVYAKIRERKTQTALIIDEFWRMGKHPVLKGPIGGFSRRGRKYNLSLIVASQCIADFEAKTSEAGAIALSQADWRILLSVDGKDEEILKRELMMSESEISLAHGLAGVKGSYSEFMLRHKNNAWAIGRLLLDPFSSQLYSTKAEDVAAIKEMRKNGLGVEKAIETLLERKHHEL